jgi:hypothetical protein
MAVCAQFPYYKISIPYINQSAKIIITQLLDSHLPIREPDPVDGVAPVSFADPLFCGLPDVEEPPMPL